MPELKRLITSIVLLVGLYSYVQSQTNPDDYWLDHGFTSGQTIYTNTGKFYDDGGFGLYDTSQNWTVTFCSENGNPITFDFNGFRTDYQGPFPNPPNNAYLPYDYLRINMSWQNVVAYHDDTPQFSFTDPDGCITFQFISQGSSLQDSGWIAEISANPPPINNDPCTAADLSVGNVCSPSIYSNKGAYNTTNLGSPSCHRYFGGDVWFTATVPESGQIKLESFSGSLSYAIMALYTGDCGSLSEIGCVDNPGSMPTVILNRTPGEIIYIRIFGDQAKSGTFGICATDPTAPVTGFTGPGGVGDSISNRLWLKTDQGLLDGSGSSATDGDQVRTWLDMSGNDNDFVQNLASGQPLLNQNGINSMPSLIFDGSDDYFFAETGNLSAPLNIFAISSFDASADQTLVSTGDANNLSTAGISRESDDRYYSFSGSKHYGPVLNGSTPYILNQKNSIDAPYHSLNLNASGQPVDDYSGSLTTDGSVHIGSSKDLTGFFNGKLGELIMYDRKLNQAQEVIINNYLAAKYGIDIQASDRYDYETIHRYDVAGIGRVNSSNIHSKAQSAGILAIGGANEMEDGEFLLFGHDNGDISSWSSVEIPGGDPNLKRLAREWRVDLSGGDGPGTVSLSINDSLIPSLPAGYLALNLMVDDDGDFSSGAADYGLVQSGEELLVNDVVLTDGSYIAIMAVKPYVQFSSSASSGEESVEHPQFEVSLNYAISDPFEVSYSVSGGTATPGGVDFSLNDGVLLFNPGVKNRVLQPLIVDDTIAELPDEFFTVELMNPTMGVLAGDTISYTYTILDNDVELQLFAEDSIIGECSGGTLLWGEAKGREPLSFSWTPSTGLSDPSNDTTTANPLSTTSYTLRATDINGNFVERSLQIEVVPAPVEPTITANGPLSFCLGDSVVLSADSAYAYIWSTAEITREITVKSSGKYFLKTTDEFGCESPYSDTIEIVVYDLPVKPVISANNGLTFCEGDSVVLSAPESDSYLWSTGDVSRSITVKDSGLFSVQVADTNSCVSPVSDIVEVVEYPLPEKPVVSFTGDTDLCQGESLELSAPASSSYLWSNGETSQTINVTTPGSHAVRVGNQYSCMSTESDAVQINVHALPEKPVIAVNGDAEFCEGGSVELTAPAAESYQWSNGATTQSITVSSSGSYTLAVGNANGCISPVSEPVEIVAHPNPDKPVISTSGATNLCQGESLELSAPAASSWLWSTGDTTRTITVTNAGNYSVIVGDQYSCISAESDAVTVNVHTLPEKPVISVNGNTEFCEGASVELSAPAAESYQWSNGATTQTITVNNPGSYTLAVGNANGCISPESDPVEIVVHPNPDKPVISISGDTDLCQGESRELSAPAASSWLWSTGDTTQTITVTNTGNYSVTIGDQYSCTSAESDAVTVNIHSLPEKPVISANGNPEFCEGASVELSAPAAESYQWSDGSTTQTIIVNSSGTYTVRVSNEFTCSSPESDPVEVTVHPIPEKPVITPAGPLSMFVGDSLILSAGDADSYLWSNGRTTQEIVIKQEGSYSVQVANAAGCLSEMSLPVEVTVDSYLPAPEITLNGDTAFCEGNSAELISDPAHAYLWSTGETSRSITVSSSGSYSLVVQNEAGISSNSSDTIRIEVYPNPDVEFTTTDISCHSGSDGSVSAIITNGKAPYIFDWNNGADAQTLSGLSAGTYTLDLQDANSCTTRADVELNQPDELQVIEEIIPADCPDASDGEITISVNGGTSPYSLRWENGMNNENRNNLAPGTYDLTVMDNNGCEITESYNLNYENEQCFKIPDIITPNNDGHNDTWQINGLQLYPSVEVEIYDRWGKRVFYSKGYLQEWEGTDNGKELPMASYHYIINLNNGSAPIIGNVTIVR